jgi:hypothetical protein
MRSGYDITGFGAEFVVRRPPPQAEDMPNTSSNDKPKRKSPVSLPCHVFISFIVYGLYSPSCLGTPDLACGWTVTKEMKSIALLTILAVSQGSKTSERKSKPNKVKPKTEN